LTNNIHIFFHIWADGKWLIPTLKFVNALRESGLDKEAKSINFGVVGSLPNLNKVKEYLYNTSLDYKIVGHSYNGFEQETLDKIIDLKEDDGYIFYAHTKGASNDTEFEHYWRESMFDDLIHDWKSCVSLLEDHAAVGCHYAVPIDGADQVCYNQHIGTDRGYFYGNFWWSHLRYLKAIGKPDRSPTTFEIYSRMDAEYWLLKLSGVVKDKDFKVYDKNPYFDNAHFKSHREKEIIAKRIKAVNSLKERAVIYEMMKDQDEVLRKLGSDYDENGIPYWNKNRGREDKDAN
jgi:hypothetical protein